MAEKAFCDEMPGGKARPVSTKLAVSASLLTAKQTKPCQDVEVFMQLLIYWTASLTELHPYSHIPMTPLVTVTKQLCCFHDSPVQALSRRTGLLVTDPSSCETCQQQG